MIKALIKWDKINGKDCVTQGKCRSLGKPLSLQEAKDRLLEHVDCRNSGSILKYSPAYSKDWGAFCILHNETKDIVEINQNWEFYVLKSEGKNSVKTYLDIFDMDFSMDSKIQAHRFKDKFKYLQESN